MAAIIFWIWLTGVPVVFFGYLWLSLQHPFTPRRRLILASITAVLWPIELICQVWRALYAVYRAIGRVGVDLSRGIR